MKSRSMLTTVAVLCLALAVSTVARAQTRANLEDEVGQSEKAAKVFGEIGRGVAPVDPSRIDASFSPNDDFIKEKP